MTTELPHAAEVRELRTRAERGNRAKALLPALEGALTTLALGGSGGAAGEVRARLEDEWSDLHLEGDLYATLTRARALLHGEVATGEAAARQMAELLHDQAHALRSESFAAVRDELNSLADRRTALSASLAPVATALSSLAPLLPTLDAQLVELDGAGSAEVAAARLEGLLTALAPVVARGGIDLELPRPDDDAPIPDRVEALRAFRDRLAAATQVLGQRQGELEAALGEIERLIRARTG